MFVLRSWFFQIVFTLCLIGLSSPLLARMSSEDRAAIMDQTERLEHGLRQQNYSIVVGIIPPRISEHIAKQSKVSVSQLHTAMVAQMESTFAQVTLDDFSLSSAGMRTQYTPNGTVFALIPTTTRITLPDQGQFETLSYTVALKDGAEWYLMRIDDIAQLKILRRVYPDFKGVEFPSGRTRALN